jgi:hypothetical protein
VSLRAELHLVSSGGLTRVLEYIPLQLLLLIGRIPSWRHVRRFQRVVAVVE